MMCWEQLIQTYLQTVLSSLRGTPLFPSFPQVRKEFLHSIYQFTSQITLSETLNQTCRCSSMIAPHFSLENKTNAIYRNFNPKSCTRNMNAYLLLKPQHLLAHLTKTTSPLFYRCTQVQVNKPSDIYCPFYRAFDT